MNKIIILILIIFYSSVLDANELYSGDGFIKRIHVNGYLGYRYMWSSLGDITPLNSGPELGLVSTIDFLENWRLYTQLSYSEVPKDALSYAFLEYSNNIFEHYGYTIQVGKIRREVGIHNKNRLDPSSRQNGIIVPQAIYWNQFETIFNSGYGIRGEIFRGRLKIGGSVTQPIGSDSEVANVVLGGTMKHESKFADGFSLWWQYQITDRLMVKMTYNNTTVNDFLKNQHLLISSLYYEGDDWDISLETQLYRFNKNADFFGDFHDGLAKGIALVFNKDINENWSYSLSGEYHVAPRDLVRPVRIANNFPKLIEYSWDFGIGGAYTNGRWQVRINIHYVKGGNFISGRDWGSGANFKDWAYIGTSLTYHF